MSRSGSTATERVDLLVDGYVGYLRRERGVSALTVDAHVPEVRRFLADHDARDLSELTAAEVSKAVLGQVGGRSPASVRRYGCALRSFLRYCWLTGLVEHDLTATALPVSGGDGRCCHKASLRHTPRRCYGSAIGAAPAADVTTP